MAAYVNDVAVRWSDQDAYGHVNHARVVTLLEDARTGLLFDAATRAGVAAFEAGLLVAALEVRYRRPIPWSPAGVRVVMTAEDVRAASFGVAYRLLLPTGDGNGSFDEAKPAATASTQLVPYDLATERPRRLTAEEREFLAEYTA
ncbi:acyl-CoA thioester hydrolase [Actinomycetospora succinea]|uniref:Acyl-CoA thioester hydrolase n=1 Tax=Actinomycetospora succinea TaxID=663603 RepID=A0A4R6V1Z2_9PSEU|nr:thioesterase family protein [Actinomycetospora succinea]TDQ54144.1 acyl-CoA thioester hydrolase [Actinomycetospora succinea]